MAWQFSGSPYQCSPAPVAPSTKADKRRGGAGAVAAKGKGLTYAAAGVDTARQKAAIKALTGSVRFRRTGRGAPLGGLSHFAGLVDFDRTTALAICTDGVGTKLEVAAATNRWDTVGIDCIAMNVNDCICVGAEPLAFVDYIATREPDAEIAKAIGVGLNRGAKQANVTLAGGETAILPELVNGWDLAGAAVGWVRKSDILDGRRIRAGDILIGLASSGLHSNGYTLARRIVHDAGRRYDERFPGAPRTIGEVLLEPTNIYVRPVLSLLRRVEVHGLANITGGGLKNVPRMKADRRYVVTDPMPVPPVFDWLRELGHVADREMYQTFNMGLGFVAAVPAAEENAARRILRPFQPQVVGRVEKGRGCLLEPLGLEYESKTG
jgi:phosphoribosylformylglycinamidine cyclo-ligase